MSGTPALSDLFPNREDPLRLLVETALEGIWVLDAEGRTTYVNAQMAAMLGRAEREIVGRFPLGFMDDAARTDAGAHFERWRAGVAEHHDFCWRRKDGSPLWTLVSVRPLRDPGGRFLGVFGMLADITERKQSELTLRASESRLQLALDATSEGVWDWNVATGEVFFSPRWLESLGYGPDDLAPHVSAWQRLVHPDDWPELAARLADHLEGRTSAYECENRLLTKAGVYRWNLDRGKVVERDADGHPLRMVGVDVDISARREADHALRERDALLDGIVQTALDAIITVDDEQRVVQFNPAAAAIFGCPADQAIGQRLGRFIPERFRHAHGEHIRQFGRESGLPRPMGSRRDLWGLRASGEEFPIEASTISQIESGGRRRYTVFLRDITSRKQRDEQLARSHAQLRELSSRLRTLQEEERTRISREIHDELGQMLTGIRMDLRWIEKRVAATAASADREACEGKLRGTVALVDDTIRTVQKIAAELRPAILDNLGLPTAIAYEAARFEARAGIRCDVQPSGEMPDVPPDVATAVFRIFQEILTNVARHAAATHVSVRLGGGPGLVELTAADNGRGIAAGDAERATSLGVLGMRERASLLGGEVTFLGAPGQGTTVTVRIPVHGRRIGDA